MSEAWRSFPKDSKPWDRDAPFHRIQSPAFKLNPSPAERADGRGRACGCLGSRDAPNIGIVLVISALRKLMSALPNWVPVKDEKEREVEGMLLRSFQTWTDFPPLQWHNWYDWNFHIDPADGYQYLRGPENVPPVVPPGFQPVVRSSKFQDGSKFQGTLECEWDCGALDRDQLFPPRGSDRPGPMCLKDWFWPQAGHFIWVAGRWIYDCGHGIDRVFLRNGTVLVGEILNEGGGLVITIRTDGGLRTERDHTIPRAQIQRIEFQSVRTELHPCKAIASARWEAVQFPGENSGLFVPAIQFMFFASTHGGYQPFALLQPDVGGDYQFIVDLPETDLPFDPLEAAIGHTPEFPLNTIALRDSGLLIKFDFAPFSRARGALAPGTEMPADLHPVVELQPPGDNPRRRQVKITIPLSRFETRQLPRTESPSPAILNAYGVVVSLGWRDLDGSQARRVKRCEVVLQEVRTGGKGHDEPVPIPIIGPLIAGLEDDEWRMRFGVNGRWTFFNREDIEEDSVLNLGEKLSLDTRTFLLHLADEDFIGISVHGMDQNAVGDWMANTNRGGRLLIFDRETLQFAGAGDFASLHGLPVRWDEHIVRTQNGSNPNPNRLKHAILFQIIEQQIETGGTENRPLGMIDPGLGPEPHNPVRVSDLITQIGLNVTRQFRLEAFWVDEVGHTAELAEQTGSRDKDGKPRSKTDYSLAYTIRVQPQSGVS